MLQSRLDAMDVVVAACADGQLATKCTAVVQAMALLPGWDEKNFQVCLWWLHVLGWAGGT